MTPSLSLAPQKRCSCGSTGPFYKNKGKPDGLSTTCRECANRTAKAWKKRNPEKRHRHSQAFSLKQNYNLTVEEWTALFKKQKGLCAICAQPMRPRGNTQDSVAVDHNHATGKVRGLLHGRCNRALGGFREDPSLLRAAAAYVEENQ